MVTYPYLMFIFILCVIYFVVTATTSSAVSDVTDGAIATGVFNTDCYFTGSTCVPYALHALAL